MGYVIDADKVRDCGLASALDGYCGDLLDAKAFNKLTPEARVAVLKNFGRFVFSGFMGKKISCLNIEHLDAHPSMNLYIEKKEGTSEFLKRVAFHCHTCGANFDVFDVIGAVYYLSSFRERYAKAVALFCSEGACREYKAQNGGRGQVRRSYNTLSGYERTLANSYYKPIRFPYDNYEESEAYAEAVNYLISRGVYRNEDESLPYGVDYETQRMLFGSDVRYWENTKSGDVYIVFVNSDGSVCRRNTNRMSVYPHFNTKGDLGIFRESQLYEGEPCFVCEGCFDALILQLLGLRAVSMNGIQNFNKLVSLADKGIMPILMPDRDNAGLKGVKDLREQFFLPSFYDDASDESILKHKEDINQAFCRVKDGGSCEAWVNALYNVFDEACRFYNNINNEEVPW